VARCDRPECRLGEIGNQGSCTECGAAPDQMPPVPEAGRAVSSRMEPWWGLGLVEASTAPAPQEEPVGTGTGELIAGQYEVLRSLGERSHGKTHLARDRNLGTEVVLKEMTPSIAETVKRELKALVGLRHDSIVRIIGYLPEESESRRPYLVLEYIRGTPLSAQMYSGDRLEVILAHGLQILQALDYLHDRGLLHMDVKPENIIRLGEQSAGGLRDRVRLIDFGAVRRLRVNHHSPDIISAVEYASPQGYRERKHPTAGFDLFCLGKTLQELCRHHMTRDQSNPAVCALKRLLERATDTSDPERRFVSAGQFAEQLSGVIRQVVAAGPTRRQITRRSVIFGSMTATLHGGLGSPRPLSDWIGASVRADGRRGFEIAAPFARLTYAEAIAALPTPRSDPDDPERTRGCEESLDACCKALQCGMPDKAHHALEEAGLPGWFWLRSWYSGLIALAHDNASAAKEQFTAVSKALPGELIPTLALGVCAEIGGDPEEACRHYETVADTAPALSAAGYGLARTHLLAGRRTQAVGAARRLARELHVRGLQFEEEAQIAIVRLRAAVTDSCVPEEDDLRKLARKLRPEPGVERKAETGLRMEPKTEARLWAEIQYGIFIITGNWQDLSKGIIDLAKFTNDRKEIFDIADLANQLRPPITWWWQRGFRRIRNRFPVSA
jgi:serine/threonine-protein kinase PknG